MMSRMGEEALLLLRTAKREVGTCPLSQSPEEEAHTFAPVIHLHLPRLLVDVHIHGVRFQT